MRAPSPVTRGPFFLQPPASRLPFSRRSVPRDPCPVVRAPWPVLPTASSLPPPACRSRADACPVARATSDGLAPAVPRATSHGRRATRVQPPCFPRKACPERSRRNASRKKMRQSRIFLLPFPPIPSIIEPIETRAATETRDTTKTVATAYSCRGLSIGRQACIGVWLVV